MQKISLEQASELLKQYVDVEVVESDKADKDVDIESIKETLTTSIVDNARGDIEAELRDTVHQSITGKVAGSTSSALAREFGMKKKDLEGLSVEAAAKKVKDYIDAQKASDGGSWQEEREALIREHEEEMEKLNTTHTAAIGEWQNKFSERDIQAAASALTAKLPRKKGDLNEHSDILLYKVRQKYDVRYNEKTKSLDLYEKGTENIAKENGKAVKAEDYARSVFDAVGIIETDTRNIKPADVKEGKETNAVVLNNEEQRFSPEVAAFAASLED